MKKVFTIISVTILVWGCAKKIAPVKSETPTSNNNASVQDATKPVTTVSTTSTASTSPSTTPTTTGTPQPYDNKSPKPLSPIDPKTLSPEEASRVSGQATFALKCNKCHAYRAASEYTDLRWVQIMQVMAIKANLSETEKTNVLAYVRANAKKG